MAATLCRDCLHDAASSSFAGRCQACGSPRLLRHPERGALSIAHVDCDAFYAAIEKRDNPELADRPVIVGGGKRGVVATCCYVARTFGIRSAMPMFKALAACPHAVVVKPDMAKYAAVGRTIRSMMLELTPLVEPISIDEAFLDLTGTERLHRASPALTLAAFARRVENEIGITVSVGLSYAKFLAKIASDMDKPRGFSILGRAEAVEFLQSQPITLLPGVGRAAASKLADSGFRILRDLHDAAPERLFATFGKDGPRLQRLSLGIDDRAVTPEHETKSVSSETTFETDISSHEDLEPIIWRLSEKTAARLRKADLAGRTLTLKLKTADFRLLTRSRQLNEPTQLAKRLYDEARALLRAEPAGQRYRLLGVGVADLTEGSTADHGDLADPTTPRIAAVERAIEKLRGKFGSDAVIKGVGLGRTPSTSRRS